MNKPTINYGKVAYVLTPSHILQTLTSLYGADENKEVRTSTIALEDFEVGTDANEFIKYVIEEAGDCEIIFHIQI